MNGEHSKVESVSTDHVASHTPGPWEAYRDNRREQYEIGHRRMTLGTRVVAEVSFSYAEPVETEQHANARLIAAAPDLLELAKQYARECADCAGIGELGGAPCDACADIRAVVAKAEGRRPDDDKRRCECGYGCPPFQGCRHD